MRISDKIISGIATHPYFIAFILCLTANLLCFGSEGNIPQNALWIEVIIAIVFGFVFINQMKRPVIFIYSAFVLVLAYRYNQSQYKGGWLFFAGTVMLLMVCVLLYDEKRKEQILSLMIIGESFLLKFYYIFYTSIYLRQNDVGKFGGTSSHFGYIEYILFNHKLPDFDPRDAWTFCHPPLHHTLSAIWIGINQYVLGVDYNAARESLQTLSLFYAMVIIIAAYKILRYFKLKGMALYISLIIISFHPSFTYLAGSVNNDILSIALMMCAIVCTIKWYEEQNIKNIIKIALCIGFAMMTKLSAAFIAPSVAVVFLYVFIKNRKTNFKKLLVQFAGFGAVCVPLGLWFEIKNLILYKIPITYVQEVTKGVPQDISDQSFWSRITDFSEKHFTNVFEQWLRVDGDGNKIGYNENNPIIALFKTSLFGEYVNESTFGENKFALSLCKPYFWLCLLLAVVFFVMMIMVVIKSKKIQMIWKVFFVLFYAFMMINIYKMSADYPMVCTMNFRYITPTVIVQALFGGIWLFECKKKYGEKQNGAEAKVEEKQEMNIVEEDENLEEIELIQIDKNGIVQAIVKGLFILTILYAVMGTVIWMVVCYNTRG